MAKRQPQTFYTSDLHLGHTKVAELRGFEDFNQHDGALIERWHDTVRPEDTVSVLGDVTGSSSTGKIDYALAILAQLPGRKHLIAGNHDAVHPQHRRTFTAFMPRYLAVFDTVAPFARRRIGGHEVILQHYPYASYGEGPHRGGAEASRDNQWRLPDLGLPILHGHTHQPEREHVEYDRSLVSRGIHVGMDAWDLAPAPQDAIIRILDGWAAA